MSNSTKLAQRSLQFKQHRVDIGLNGDYPGYISIEDTGLYPDDDSRTHRREQGFNTIMIPLMTRQDLKDLKTAIKEVLKNTK